MGLLTDENQNQQPEATPQDNANVDDIQVDVPGVDPGAIDETYKRGIDILFNERFDKLVNMFKANGVEGFPQAMATAINSTLRQIEGEAGMDPVIAAAVGSKLFVALLETMVDKSMGGEEVLPKLEVPVIQEAFKRTLDMYAQSHPEVSEQDVAAVGQQLAQKEGAIANGSA